MTDWQTPYKLYPGPWKSQRQFVKDAEGVIVCKLIPRDDEEGNACIVGNSQAISALPDLIAACKAFVAALAEGREPEYSMAVAALRKAGEL